MNEKDRIVITFPNKLLKALRIVAAHQECSIASLVRISCAHYLHERHQHELKPMFIDILIEELGLEV